MVSRALLSPRNPGADGNVWKYSVIAAWTVDLIMLLAGGGCVCRQVKAACLCPAKHALTVCPQGMDC